MQFMESLYAPPPQVDLNPSPETRSLQRERERVIGDQLVQIHFIKVIQLPVLAPCLFEFPETTSLTQFMESVEIVLDTYGGPEDKWVDTFGVKPRTLNPKP